MTKYIAILLLIPFSLLGQSGSAPTNTEEPPTLNAKEILNPDFLAGDGFTVQDEVPTSTGRNRYLITSEYGEFEADGNIMLERRINEVAAIRKLKEVSRTDAYKNALKAAVASPLGVAKDVVTNPGGHHHRNPERLVQIRQSCRAAREGAH